MFLLIMILLFINLLGCPISGEWVEHLKMHAHEVYRESLQEWEAKIVKMTDLFMRLDTNQSELVATVLFTANSLINSSKEQCTEIDILREVMKWKQKRQPPLNEAEVAYTIRNLAALNWLSVKPSTDLPLSEELIS